MTPEQIIAEYIRKLGPDRVTVGPKVTVFDGVAGVQTTPDPKPSKAAKPIKESEFMAQVIAYARANGWLVAHFRPSLNSRGEWQTAVQADGAGFPDLVLVRDRVIVAELKVGKNKPSDKQNAWLWAFEKAGVQAYIWRPELWPIIRNELGAKS